jgi:bifunctional DNA-binding transcriptional regulator/antitoxin component of YhaV-PrlF toxin-antitoxin module
MAKVTSKYQVTVPRAIAEQYKIRPGDDIQWQPAGEVIRVVPPHKRVTSVDRASKHRLFDLATKRRRRRSTASSIGTKPPLDRGWKRENLYERGRTR